MGNFSSKYVLSGFDAKKYSKAAAITETHGRIHKLPDAEFDVSVHVSSCVRYMCVSDVRAREGRGIPLPLLCARVCSGVRVCLRGREYSYNICS